MKFIEPRLVFLKKELAEQDRLSDDIKISVAAQIDSHISTVKKGYQ